VCAHCLTTTAKGGNKSQPVVTHALFLSPCELVLFRGIAGRFQFEVCHTTSQNNPSSPGWVHFSFSNIRGNLKVIVPQPSACNFPSISIHFVGYSARFFFLKTSVRLCQKLRALGGVQIRPNSFQPPPSVGPTCQRLSFDFTEAFYNSYFLFLYTEENKFQGQKWKPFKIHVSPWSSTEIKASKKKRTFPVPMRVCFTPF
jgi:hypothetical protein